MAEDKRNQEIDLDKELEALNRLLNSSIADDAGSHKFESEISESGLADDADSSENDYSENEPAFDIDNDVDSEDSDYEEESEETYQSQQPQESYNSDNDEYYDEPDTAYDYEEHEKDEQFIADEPVENISEYIPGNDSEIINESDIPYSYDFKTEPKGYVSPDVARIINSITEESGYTDIEPMKVESDVHGNFTGANTADFYDDSDFTDISSDSDSDFDENDSSDVNYSDFSSEQNSTSEPDGTYDYDDSPKFFTESSEYDEKPLDISDFYPPVLDDSDDNANDADESADSDISTAEDYAENEPEPEYDDWENSAAQEDEFADSYPEESLEDYAQSPTADDNTIIFDAASTESSAPVDDETKVFAAVDSTLTDKITDRYGADDSEYISDAFARDDDDDYKRAFEDEDDKSSLKAEKTADGDNGKAEDKPKGFMRFVRAIIPWKGDAKKEVARKIIFIVAFVTMIVMLWQVSAYYLIEPFMNDRMNENLQEEYNQKTSSGYSSPVMNPKFQSLYEKNNDLVGWITVKDTNINYPVLRGETNKKWERTTFDGESRRFGSIFMDCTSSIEYGAESRNIVIYGHNMMDDSTMFSQLTHYRDDFEFYKKHPTFTFDSLYNDGTWEIFSVITTNAFAAQNNGYCFDYRKSTFADDNEFNAWIAECKARSCITNNVDVKPTDTILTLQTCVYEFTGARLVIQARRTRDDSDTVDVSSASVNKNAIYPQAWYDAKGIKNPNTQMTNAVQFNNTDNTSDPLEPEENQPETTAADDQTSQTQPNGVVATIKTPASVANGSSTGSTSVTAGKTDKTEKTTKKSNTTQKTTKKSDGTKNPDKTTAKPITKPDSEESTTKKPAEPEQTEPIEEEPGSDDSGNNTEGGDESGDNGDSGDSGSDSGDNGGEDNNSDGE